MEFSNACADVYYILENMQESELKKIPKKIIDLIRLVKSDDYITLIDINTPLEEQRISDATKGLISLIYNRYLGSEEEKEQYKREYNSYLEMQQKKSGEIIFNKKVNENKNEETGIVQYSNEKSIFKKIIEKIKTLFKIR